MAKGKVNDPKITPLGERVLIKLLDKKDQETKSASGIIIPASAKDDKPDRGQVVAIGTGRVNNDGKLIPLNVKVGDKVIFQWGEKLTIDEVEFHIVNETNILAVVKS